MEFLTIFSSTSSQILLFFVCLLLSLSKTHSCKYTTGNTKALTSLTFVANEISLSFQTLCNPFMATLPNIVLLMISLEQSPSSDIVDPRKLKLCTTSISTPSTLKELNGTFDKILVLPTFK